MLHQRYSVVSERFAAYETASVAAVQLPVGFVFVCGVDDGVRQAVVAVEALRLVAECIDFSDQVTFIVVSGFPDTTIGERGFGHQRRTQMVLVADLAPQRIGLFDQAGEVVVLERQLIAIG